MTDVEKHGNAGMTPADNTLNNTHNAAQGANPQSHLPVGSEAAAHYPYTLGASSVQQHFYQGGLPLRKLANPAPL